MAKQVKQTKSDHVDFIIRFEGGELESEEELIEGFQQLIDSGIVWSLQGFYGRTAADLINRGVCHA
jgi:hypothetical protein